MRISFKEHLISVNIIKMAKPHYVIYYDQRILEIIKTKPRNWARANPVHFPAFGFTNSRDHPTDNVVEAYLRDNFNFQTLVQDNYVITFNFTENILPANGNQFIL
jgi:hypothetical protein